jgi:hypothetical protein
VLTVLGLAAAAAAGDLTFSDPQFLPGDLVPGAAAGHQERARIARGGNQSLAVWIDSRTSPDIGWPQSTEGSGADIYAARIDADGNVIDTSPIMINQDFGDQSDPNVAWNGENWLVAWQAPINTLSNTQLLAVRVDPDGTVLDHPPIQLYTAGYELLDIEIAGGDSTWMIVTQSTGGVEATVRAIAVAADGSMPIPGGISIYEEIGLFVFDVAYATGEYLITWGNQSGARFGRLFGPGLEIGPWFWLPFVDTVASDGTDFLVLRAESSGPLASVDAIRVMHDGSMPDPAFTIFVQQDAQAGNCCAEVVWDGTYYWTSWSAYMLARVTADGTLLDPGGFQMELPATMPTSALHFTSAPGGGLQAVWNDGVGGAAYPKDVYTGRVSTTGEIVNESLLSLGAPAQLETDFAEGDGMHLVTYLSRSSGTGRVMAQRIDTAGNAIDAEPVEVASGPIPGLGLPWIQSPAAAWNGSLFMITWSDGFQVFGRRMLPDGTFLDATPLTIMDGHEPDVAAVGQVFLVVALDFINGNVQWQSVYSMRVDGATGANLDAESILVGGDFVIFARHPHLVSWGDRWLAVSQFNLSHDNTIAGTGAAIIDANGTSPGWIGIPIGWRPDVAVSDDRALFVAVSHTIASAHADIEGQVMLADGSLLGNWFTISDAPDKQLMPTATWNGTDFVVAWEDKRNSVYYFDERTDIYGARVSVNGVVLDPAGVPLAATPEPEVDAELLSSGGTTLLAASTFRPDPGLDAYRIGIQAAGLPVLAGDANGDGLVNVDDLLAVIVGWGPCDGCSEDFDGNGAVDVDDLVTVLLNWTL